MRRLATLAVVAALMSPTTASGQNYTFGDWARDHGYSPGDVMPEYVSAVFHGDPFHPAIDSLDGIGEFDWNTTPTDALHLFRNQLSSIEAGYFDGLTYLTELLLENNQLSSIESGAFSGLTNLQVLQLSGNQLSSIESGDFSGMINLGYLDLSNNQISSIESGALGGLTNLRRLPLGGNTTLTELNLAEADLSSFSRMSSYFDVGGNSNIGSVSLRSTVVNQTALVTLLGGGSNFMNVGIGDLDGITELDLSGIDFVDITDLEPLYVMNDLTDLWFVNTQNVDAIALDVLLNNLETIESTEIEGILYLTEADFDGFNTAGGGLLADWHAEPGHHVEFLQIGDVNHDTEFNGRDVDPFVRVLLASRFDVAADMNGDGVVNGLDVDPFVAAVVGGGAQPIPESSTAALAAMALIGLVCLTRRARG